MCFINDGSCDFFETSTPKARKEHKCYECGEVIPIGDNYLYMASKFEGEFSIVKVCRRCEYMRKLIFDREVANGYGRHEAWCPYGDIRYHFEEYGFTEFISSESVPSDWKMDL